MNPRDEKILITLKTKQKAKYSNLVPFEIISSCLPWVDGTELSCDLIKLSEDGYLIMVENPLTHMGYWYSLTSKGHREYERIKHENTEVRKDRIIQLACVVIGFLLGKFF